MIIPNTCALPRDKVIRLHVCGFTCGHCRCPFEIDDVVIHRGRPGRGFSRNYHAECFDRIVLDKNTDLRTPIPGECPECHGALKRIDHGGDCFLRCDNCRKRVFTFAQLLGGPGRRVVKKGGFAGQHIGY